MCTGSNKSGTGEVQYVQYDWMIFANAEIVCPSNPFVTLIVVHCTTVQKLAEANNINTVLYMNKIQMILLKWKYLFMFQFTAHNFATQQSERRNTYTVCTVECRSGNRTKSRCKSGIQQKLTPE